MKRKKSIANMIMVAAIALVAAAGILLVGNNRGWFATHTNMHAICDKGVAELTRGGVAAHLEEETGLRSGDSLTLHPDAQVAVTMGDSTCVLGESACANIDAADAITLQNGETLIVANTPVTLTVNDQPFTLKNSVVTVSCSDSAANIGVLRGKVADASAGELLRLTADNAEVTSCTADCLSDFLLNCAKTVPDEICLTADEIEQVLAQRQTQQVETGGDGVCTVEIRCDSILDHMDDLQKGKDAYVPEDGVILAATQVSFTNGETAFDALKRACEQADIPLEYSWTPVYNSYYVEGIHHLYEFDCGTESGWMFKVNDHFPNYGSSEYKLSPNDTVVWCYTCQGLGKDVGGSVD